MTLHHKKTEIPKKSIDKTSNLIYNLLNLVVVYIGTIGL